MPSYSRWATDIVRRGLKPSLRLASCWRVLVVNGGAGLRFDFLTATEVTTGLPAAIASRWVVAVSSSPISGFWPSIRTRSAVNVAASGVAPCGARSTASRVQYSRALKARISRSRSTTMRTATDWTRPAERPVRTFFQSSGLSR